MQSLLCKVQFLSQFEDVLDQSSPIVQVVLVMLWLVEALSLIFHLLLFLQPEKVQVDLHCGNISWHFLDLVQPVEFQIPPPASFLAIFVFKAPGAVSSEKRRTGGALLEVRLAVQSLDLDHIGLTTSREDSPVDVSFVLVAVFSPQESERLFL